MIGAVQLCLLDQNQCLFWPKSQQISPSVLPAPTSPKTIAVYLAGRCSNLGKHEDIKLNPGGRGVRGFTHAAATIPSGKCS